MKYFLWRSWVTHYFSFLCLFSFQMKLVSPPHLPAQIRLICLGAQTWSEQGYFQHKYAELTQSTCGSSESCGPRFQIAAKETGYEIVQLGRALFTEHSSTRLSSRWCGSERSREGIKKKGLVSQPNFLRSVLPATKFLQSERLGKAAAKSLWLIYLHPIAEDRN